MKTSTKTLVTVSIVLNVLFIGFFLGSITKDCKHRMGPKKNFNPGIMEKLKSIKEDAHQHMSEMQSVRKEIMEVLIAEEFDPIAFDNASAKLHQCRGEMMCSMTDKIKAMASTMSLEERKELAMVLKHQFKSRYKKRKHH
jgi:uncharacterized membrane protein